MTVYYPDLNQLHRQILDDHSGYLPEDDTSEGSEVWYRTRVLVMLAWHQLHAFRLVERDLMPDTASGEALDRVGKVFGVARKGATPARKADALRVVGTPGSVVEVGTELVHISGQRFQITEEVALATGRADVDVAAVDTGSATRLDAGQVLTIVSPPLGVMPVAALQKALDEDGTDRETDAAYRQRILDRIAQPSMGGNANDYRAWALERPGIASAYVYPLRAGRGSVDLATLHSGRRTARLLTLAQRGELHSLIDARRPVGMHAFRVLEVRPRIIDVEVLVDVLPGSGLSWDWHDNEEPVRVTSWEEDNRALGLDCIPSDLRPGHRIIIKTSGSSGEEVVVEEVATSAPDEVVLAAVPNTAPEIGDEVYSGGDVVQPVRERLEAFFDLLGPAIGERGIGDWLDEVDPDHLLAVALQHPGIRRGRTLAPTETVAPADPPFPEDNQIELVIPGRVLVRRYV